jgi:hypothetical protein
MLSGVVFVTLEDETGADFMTDMEIRGHTGDVRTLLHRAQLRTPADNGARDN